MPQTASRTAAIAEGKSDIWNLVAQAGGAGRVAGPGSTVARSTARRRSSSITASMSFSRRGRWGLAVGGGARGAAGGSVPFVQDAVAVSEGAGWWTGDGCVV